MLNYYIISSFINFITSFALGILFIYKKSKYSSFIWLNFVIAGWAFFYFLWQISTTYANALIFTQLLTVFSVMMAFFSIKFLLDYLNETESHYWLMKINLILMIFFSLFSFTPYMILKLYTQSGFEFWPIAGKLYPIFLIYFLGNISYGHIRVLLSKKNKEKKNYLFLATIIGFLGGSTNFFLWFMIPIAPIGNILLSVYIIIMAYTVAKYELMDIKVIIRSTPAYILTSIVILVSSGLISYYVYLNRLLNTFTFLCLCLFWGFATRPLHKFFITRAQRAFVRGYYDPETIMKKLNTQLSIDEPDRKTIFTTIEKILDEELEVEKSKIIVACRGKDEKLEKYELSQKDSLQTSEFSLNHQLIARFKEKTEIVLLEKLAPELIEEFKQLGFNNAKRTVLIPFYSPEILEGIVILGERSADVPYKETDFQVFKQVIAYASGILFRLTPTEIIRNQLETKNKALYEERELRLQVEKDLFREQRAKIMDDLIRNYNHQLMNPIQGIKLTVDNLLNLELSTDRQRELLIKIQQKLDHAEMIINRTLDLNKKDQKGTFNINKVVESALSQIEIPSRIKIIKDLGQLPDILGYEILLEQAIVNLVNNAIEAIPKKGDIKLMTYLEGKNIILKVMDNGMGILPENQSKIFSGTYHTTKPTTGHGVGLDMCAQIIKRHDGFIDFESEPGKGTTFTIKIPVS